MSIKFYFSAIFLGLFLFIPFYTIINVEILGVNFIGETSGSSLFAQIPNIELAPREFSSDEGRNVISDPEVTPGEFSSQEGILSTPSTPTPLPSLIPPTPSAPVHIKDRDVHAILQLNVSDLIPNAFIKFYFVDETNSLYSQIHEIGTRRVPSSPSSAPPIEVAISFPTSSGIFNIVATETIGGMESEYSPPVVIRWPTIQNIDTTPPVKNVKIFERTYKDGDLAPDCEFDECNFDFVFKLGNDILDFLIALAVTLAALAAIVIGFKLLFATSNPTKLNEAKEIAKLYLIGFIILLSSWLIVKAVFEILGAKSDPFVELDKK